MVYKWNTVFGGSLYWSSVYWQTILPIDCGASWNTDCGASLNTG